MAGSRAADGWRQASAGRHDGAGLGIDPDEFLRVKRIPLSQAVEEVMSGHLRDAKTALGILMAWQRLKG